LDDPSAISRHVVRIGLCVGGIAKPDYNSTQAAWVRRIYVRNPDHCRRNGSAQECCDPFAQFLLTVAEGRRL
jgi:hypothetical protein